MSSSANRALSTLLRVESRVTVGSLIRLLCPTQASVAESLGIPYGSLRNWASRVSPVPRIHLRALGKVAGDQALIAQQVTTAFRIKAVSGPLRFVTDFEVRRAGPRHYPNDIADSIRVLCLTRRAFASLVPVNYSTLRNWAADLASPSPQQLFDLGDAAEGHMNALMGAELKFGSERVDTWIGGMLSA